MTTEDTVWKDAFDAMKLQFDLLKTDYLAVKKALDNLGGGHAGPGDDGDGDGAEDPPDAFVWPKRKSVLDELMTLMPTFLPMIAEVTMAQQRRKDEHAVALLRQQHQFVIDVFDRVLPFRAAPWRNDEDIG